MAETLPNGTVIPQGADLINSNGVQAMRNLGSSVDSQIANRALVGHTHTQTDIAGLGDTLNGKRDITATELGAGSLNDVMTPGVYYQSHANEATLASNYPEATAGVLLVERSPRPTIMARQVYAVYSQITPRTYFRNNYNGTWGEWGAFAHVADLDQAISGLGANFAAKDHSHDLSQIAGAESALAGKAPTAHTHVTDDVQGLSQTLDSKSDVGHNHDAVYPSRSEVAAQLSEIATAYDVARAEGFEGDVGEWLASLVGPRGPEGPYGGTEVTDPQVASFVSTATATKAALDRAYVRGIDVTAHGAVGDGVADDRAAIQAAIDLGASLGVDVVLPAGHTFRTTSHIAISAPVRIDGRGATLRAEGTASAVVISSSYVTIEGLTIVGNGAEVFAGANRGILSMGTAEAPFTGIHLADVSVRAMTDTAIRCDWWTDSSITGGRLSDLAYAGIIAQSAQRLRIDGVSVEDVWQHDADQSYGISITDNVNTVEGRSRDVTVNGCTVSNVAHWTALSTHGGERISFTNNRVVSCHRGIIYGAGNPTRVVAATDGLVTGNIIDGAGAGGSTGLGVIGQTGGVQSTALRSGNLVRNHARLFEASTNGVWYDDTQVLGSDAGFPIARAGVTTAEEVVDRITVPPSSFVRRVSVVSSVYATSSHSANRCDIRVYADGVNIGTTRRALPGSGLPESIPGVGSAEIPASSAPTVIEVRAALNSGTGTMTTSASGGLTTTAVTVARV